MTPQSPCDIGSLLTVDVATSVHAVCIQLAGELDLSTVQQLNRAVIAVDTRGRLPVVIDVTALTFCDGRGLSELLALERRLGSSGRPVAFLGASRPLRRLMRITGADLTVNIW